MTSSCCCSLTVHNRGKGGVNNRSIVYENNVYHVVVTFSLKREIFRAVGGFVYIREGMNFFHHSRIRLGTDNMSDLRTTVGLGNGRYAKVQTWQKEPRLDLREWELRESYMNPTKKGISLKLHQIKSLSEKWDLIDEIPGKHEGGNWHLGYNVYISVQEGNPCVDIRQFWKPPNHSETVPTKKGLCLRPVEYGTLKSNWEEILRNLPELEGFVLCYEGDDHLNQVGMLRCPACNPNDCENWQTTQGDVAM